MKILVTGATGFIGSQLVKTLAAQGHDVYALVRDKHAALGPSLKAVYGDITDKRSLDSIGSGFDRLYHLAAKITFDRSKMKELLSVNGEGTENILEAAKINGIKKTVVVSSACTAGISYSSTNELDENSVPSQNTVSDNPYMRSKIACEKAALRYSKDISVAIVNPTTVYGPGDKTMNSGTLIKTVAKSKILPVPPGGTNVVDVADVVDGIVKAGERGVSGKRYILGGTNLQFSQAFAIIIKVLGISPLKIFLPAFTRLPLSVIAGFMGNTIGSRFITPQIIADLYSFKYYSSELAVEEIGWKRRYDFEASVQRALAYYRENGLWN